MTADPFDALRAPAEPSTPRPEFVARLRARVAAALDAVELPVIDVPSPQPTTPTPTTRRARSSTMLIPYLCLDGAAAAIDWYNQVLGAIEVNRYVGDDGRIGHAELRIGEATLYLADEYPEYGYTGPRARGGTSVALHLDVDDADAVYAAAVGAGATGEREPTDEAYGARSGTFFDPFGHRWMIQTTLTTPSAAEISAAMEGYTVVEAPPPATDATRDE